MLRRSSFLFALALVLSSPASADILAGKICETGCDRYRAISIFGDTMDGNTEPLSLLGGPNQSGMLDASDLTYDPVERTIIVSDFYGQQVHVFARDARNDVAPLRSFSNIFLGQVRNVAVAQAHNEYIAISASFIYAFPRSANGVVNALRNTSYAPALVQNLNGLVYLPDSDEIAVGDYYDAGGGQFAGEILIFPRTISGAPVTSRRIAGPATQLGSFISDLDYNPITHELYVLAADGDGNGRLLTFPVAASGDAAPTRMIAGAATRMGNAAGLSYYALRDELLVGSGSYNSALTRVLGFPRLANGDVAPSRDISGPDTGVGGTYGWYDVLGLPLVELFASSFE